jgi:hypothetical protein
MVKCIVNVIRWNNVVNPDMKACDFGIICFMYFEHHALQ